MKKLKAFLYVYKKSLSALPYYKEVLKINSFFSLKYFLFLAVLATIITSVRVAVPLIPEVASQADFLISELSDIYPDELVIKSADGKWEINKPEPFTIGMPSSLSNEETGLPSNLLVFHHKGTINDLEKRDTMALINDVNIIVKGDLNKIEAYPLTDLPEGTFSKDKFEYMVEGFRGYLKYIPPALFSFILLGTFFYYFVFRLFYLLSVAIILLIIGSFMNLQLNLGASYRVAIHTFTLPLTIEVLLTLLGVDFTLSFWFLLVNLAFGVFVLVSLSKTVVAKKKPQEIAEKPQE